MLVVAVCITIIATAQTDTVFLKRKSRLAHFNKSLFLSGSFKKLNNKNNIALLKQDRMPCVIPITGNYTMPNAFSIPNNTLGIIPNAWKHTKIIDKANYKFLNHR
ncbi:MAG: hypothetical protein ACK5NK_05395 [Niabella sp.]